MDLITSSDMCIATDDRAFMYGDGTFTTCLIEQSQIKLLPLHLKRLKHACRTLAIHGVDWDRLEAQMADCADNNPERAVLKVLISRGRGGRGYQLPETSVPTVVLSINPYPDHYDLLKQRGVALGISDISLAKQPLLAGLKHLNRLEQVLIRSKINPNKYDDVIVTDTDGFVVECSASNIFWRQNDIWYTPALNQSGVAGVMREFLLERMKLTDIPWREIHSSLDALVEADSVFICNSLMEIMPVKSIQFDGNNACSFNPEIIDELEGRLLRS